MKIKFRVDELARERGWREADLVRETGLANLTARNLLKGYTVAARLETLECLMRVFELENPGDLFKVTKDDNS